MYYILLGEFKIQLYDQFDVQFSQVSNQKDKHPMTFGIMIYLCVTLPRALAPPSPAPLAVSTQIRCWQCQMTLDLRIQSMIVFMTHLQSQIVTDQMHHER